MNTHTGPSTAAASPAAPSPLRRGAALAAGLTAAALLGAATAPAALAHDTLLSSSPEEGAEVTTAPDEVVLTFSADIGEGGNGIVVNDPSGTDRAVGEPEVDGPDATVAVDGLTEAGEYTVGYRVVSSDGHVVEDEFAFTLSEEAVADAAPPESASPAGGGGGGAEDTGSGDASPAEEVPSSDPVSLFGPVAGAVIGIAVLAGAAIAVIIAIGRRRNGGRPGPDSPERRTDGGD